MTTKKEISVTMRVKVGDAELEVTGPADFVQSRIDKFIDSVKSAPSLQSQRSIPQGQSVALPASELPKGMSIAQFMKKFSLKSDVDRALFAGYYLEHYQSADRFTAGEIRDTIKAAKVSPPTNTSHVINQNIKKGYMMTAGDKDKLMAFVLTSDGEQVVEELFGKGE